MTAKLEKAARRQQILDEAVRQAARVGYSNIKRKDITDALGVSEALVNVHFGTMTQFKRDVMRAAVVAAGRGDTPALKVVAQGLATNDKHAKKAPEVLKKRALASLAA